MTKKEAVKQLNDLHVNELYDPEGIHENAERIILEYLKENDEELYNSFIDVKNRCAWWAFA